MRVGVVTSPSVGELNPVGRRRVIALEIENEALRSRVVLLEAELAELRPPRPPKGWLNTKRAAALAGRSEPTIYKRVRSGKVASIKIAGKIWIDPRSV